MALLFIWGLLQAFFLNLEPLNIAGWKFLGTWGLNRMNTGIRLSTISTSPLSNKNMDLLRVVGWGWGSAKWRLTCATTVCFISN